jgi:F-type H+-transporting ATPase subunit gamma
MKMVAAAKLRRAQQAAEAGRPYTQRLEAVMAGLAGSVNIGPESPKLLAGTGADQTHLLVVCTSDRGLAGAFNSNIVRAARKAADDLMRQGKTVHFYLVGRKGRAVIGRLFPKQIVHQYDTSAMKYVSFADAQAIAQDIIQRFNSGAFDIAHLFYARFQSALVQEPTQQQIIPVPMPKADASATGTNAAVEYEPEEEDILAALLPRNVAVQVFRAMLENAASEQGSRMTAMDNATRNAGDMINRLSIQYNRTRQAAITTELVEIISGAEAL